MVPSAAYQTGGSTGFDSDEKDPPWHGRVVPLLRRHFAIAVWALLLVLLVRQVFHYGTDVPVADDCIMIAELRPDAELSFATLWMTHNEHRIPLAKLAWHVTVGGLNDARAGTFLTVILMAASAWLCMRTARTLRGHAHFTDAFFPLLLMHGAQSENVLNSFQLAFSTLSAAILLALVLIATSDERPGLGLVFALGCVALSMPLLGGCGLPHAVAWTAWLLYVFKSARGSEALSVRQTGWVALAFALLTALLTVWYFVDYHPSSVFRPATPQRFIATTLQFMARGIGEPALDLQPLGSWVVVGLLIWTAGLLRWIWSASDTQQARAIGAVVVLLGMLGTAAAIGFGRGMDGTLSGLLERYGLISAPLWCVFFLVAVLAWERAAGRALAVTLFALAAASFVPNFISGEREGSARREKADALEADLAAGLSIEEIAAQRWQDFFYSPELFATVLRDLEAAGMRPFNGMRSVRAKPPFQALRSEPLPTVSAEDVQAREARGRSVVVVRDGAVLEFALGPRPVDARGVFGIHPQVLEFGVAPSARFSIELRRADGSRAVLHETTIDPRSPVPGSPEMAFDVRFDASAADGKLALCITHGPEAQIPWAGYWRDVLVR